MNTTAPITTVEMDILIAKVEKMWRRANHPNTPPAEKEVAQAKALSLMEQHRIERAMLNIDETDELGDHLYGQFKGGYGLLHITFVGAVATAFDCRIWWQHYGMNYTLYVTGFRSDVDRVKALANFLLNDAIAQAAEFTSNSIARTKDYRRSFVQGYRAEVAQRLREAANFGKQEAVEAVVRDAAVVARTEALSDTSLSPDEVEEYVELAIEEARKTVQQRVAGAALVLVDRSKQVSEFHNKKKLRHSAGPRGARSLSGYNNGKTAGRNADLSGGRNRVGSGTKALGR